MTEERKQALMARCNYLIGGAPDIDVQLAEFALAALTQPASPDLKLPAEKPRREGSNDTELSQVYELGIADGFNRCLREVAKLNAPHTAPIEPICATGGAEWVKCSDRMPAIKDGSWRTPLPVLVLCELGVIPAYARTYTTIGGEKKVGFMASLTLGNARGKHPESLYSSEVLTQVTMWSDMPAAPEEE